MRLILAVLAALLPGAAGAQLMPGPVGPTPFLATGGTTPISSSDRAAQAVNVKDFGAKGDTEGLSSCTIAAGSAALYCPAAAFTAADVGKYFYLGGTGTANVPQTGTIIGRTDATHATLSGNAVVASPQYSFYSPPSARITVATPGSGFVPGTDVVTLAGGTSTVPATLSTTSTQVSSAAVAAGHAGSTCGGTSATLTGTTGTGTKFQATATVSAGAITAITAITVPGAYTVNPTAIANEPVTGDSCTGVQLAITMGWLTGAPVANGVYSVPPTSPVAMASSTGAGTGATFNASGYQVAGKFLYGTDDSVAVTAAAAAAVASGKKLAVPTGGYMLATQAAAIPLNGIAVEGDGKTSSGWPFVGSGSWLLIFNQSTAAFSGFAGTDWNGVSLYWPVQDGSAATPIAFPAAFYSTQFVNSSFRNSRFVNARDLLEVAASGTGSGLGRVTFSNVTAYCVRYCFDFLNGSADTLQIDATNYFGPGGFDNSAIYGPANLGAYTATNGEWMHVDVGAAAYTHLDGLMLTGFITNNMRYGIRVVSGYINVSNMTNLNWDSVQTPVSVEGNAQWLSTAYTGGEVYATNSYSPSDTGAAFSFAGSKQSELQFTGVHLSYAMGHVFNLGTYNASKINISGNDFNNWGRTTTAATYYGVYYVGSNDNSLVSGNAFGCNRNTNGVSGILDSRGAGVMNVSGNTFISCTDDIVVQGSAGTVIIAANNSISTQRYPIYDLAISGHITVQGTNQWDGAPSLRAPALSNCGGSPAIVGDNTAGQATVGTTTTTCTLTFAGAFPYTPRSITVSSGAAATPVAVTAKSASAFTFSTVLAFCAPRRFPNGGVYSN